MINLREMTLMYRVKYYVDGSTSTIKKALGCLERYFFLLAFCSYVSEQSAVEYRIMFSSWIKSRTGESVSFLQRNPQCPHTHAYIQRNLPRFGKHALKRASLVPLSSSRRPICLGRRRTTRSRWLGLLLSSRSTSSK